MPAILGRGVHSYKRGACVDNHETAALAARVEQSMHAFRRTSPLTPLDTPAGVFYTITRWDGGPYAQPMAWLATSGCSHVARHGGCTMCDFGYGQFTWDEILSGLADVLAGLRGAPLLHLFPSGSYLDEAEMPREIAKTAFKMAVDSGAREIGIESRCEFVTADALMELLRDFSGSGGRSLETVSIGIGVECFDETVGTVCVNKHSNREGASRTPETLASVRDALAPLKVVSEAHVLLKPPGFSEREAVEDAVKATLWCFESGFDRVILMPCSVKPGSILYELTMGSVSLEYSYQPPSLWSVAEFFTRIPEGLLPRLRVHGFASNTPLGIGPTTCPACHEAVVALLQFFNATGKRAALDAVDRISCPCRHAWREQMQTEVPESLDARVEAFVVALEIAAGREAAAR